MKAIIKTLDFKKEVETKFGVMYQFEVTYNDVKASFLCKNKEKPTFTKGKEEEFVETSRVYNGVTYYNIKPIKKYAGYNKNVKREQSKYAGFAMSYAKDLCIADKIKTDQMFALADKMFNWMVEKDKNLEA